MDITWHGNSCFTIKTKSASVVINPYKDGKGLKTPSLKGDIVIVTGESEGNDNVEAVAGEPKVVDWAGEYEIAGVVLTATPSPSGIGFLFTMSGETARICYLENVGKKLEEEMVDKIGEVDILILPVGGEHGMDAEAAHNIAETIEPRCIIPMNYNVEGSTAGLKDVEAFLKLTGAPNATPEEKYSISSRSELKDDSTECVVLKPQLG